MSDLPFDLPDHLKISAEEEAVLLERAANTTLDLFGVPLDGGGRGGILKPIQAYQFRVIPQQVSPEIQNSFAQQIVSAKFDFVNSRLTVRVRATILRKSFEDVLIVAQNELAPLVQPLDGGDGALFTIMPCGSKLVRYEVVFDYGDGGFLVHEMEWSFTSISICK